VTAPQGNDDRLRVGLAASALFAATAGFISIKTGRDALYLQGDGLFGVPKAFIATAFGAIPQAMAMLWALRRLGPRVTRIGVMLITMGVVLAYWSMAEPGASSLMTLFFFVVPLIFSVLFSMVWLLGTELLDHLDSQGASRAFSYLGAASIIGGVAGGAVARTLGPALGPRGLFLVGIVFLVATLGLVSFAHHRFAGPGQPPPTEKGNPGALWDAVRRGGVGLQLVIAMTAAVSGIFVDFQFYLGAVGNSSAANTTYFANVYLLLSGASLVLQLLVAPRLQRWLGVNGSLMVLPATLFGSAGVVMGLGTVMARAGLRVVEGSIKSGVHRTSWEQAYLTVPKETRASAKVLVDGLAARIAEGLAGVALLAWLHFAAQGHALTAVTAPWIASVSATWITLALLGSTLAWTLASYLLYRRLSTVSDKTIEGRLRAPLPDS
jgi:hypothetical protein